ncbi:glycerophosphocholine cholinephosphodiesterase ENPP6-like [Dreissena polymorpha]|uniref:glycerophosphocholine cholinephosphodiesterase ENPP6-like n=1 Tax=Dreissena polymorpha TaxID=45954 RepID=UPI00226559ED|nr:glycerophosphocholine cholinephosphodiesterase ENPP6-like [Dreissena polymorpha]
MQNMKLERILLVTTCFVIASLNINAVSKKSKLLFLLVDGFRWDYFDLPGANLSGFDRLFQYGVRAQWMVPDFPTNSFPNYKSLETGLHVEGHGFVGNYMWDESTGNHFELPMSEQSSFLSSWWDVEEPFYITADRQGIRTGLFNVRGCDIIINGVVPSLCEPFLDNSSTASVSLQLQHALEMLQHDQIDIAYRRYTHITYELHLWKNVYHMNVDTAGHNFGPNSKEVEAAVTEVDAVVSELLDVIESIGDPHISLVLVSDHGMTSVDQTHKINISEAIDIRDVRKILDSGTQTLIWPQPGKTEQVYNRLREFHKNLKVFNRADILDRWFFKKHSLIPPIFVTADKGWYIVHQNKVDESYASLIAKPWHGNHGFDNDDLDMMAIFAAYGPDFKKNVVVKPFSIVNVYQVICHVAGIKPHPHNGTWNAVQDMFVEQELHTEL